MSVFTGIRESTMTHKCSFLSLQTRHSACVFYIRTAPEPAASHTFVVVLLWIQAKTEVKKMLNKVVIFVFFACKNIHIAS